MEKLFDVTWTVNGGVKVRAASADAAMQKVQAMTLDEILLVEHVEFNGPEATEAVEIDAPADPNDRTNGFDAEPGKPPLGIEAEAHTDDHHVELKFDAVGWFRQAFNADVIALAECGWGGDYPADQVALHFDNTSTKPLFEYISVSQKINGVGFECHVDAEQALAWLRRHRPELAQAVEEITE